MAAKRVKLVRWAGSKQSVAAFIEKYADFDRPYIEPFGGSAVMFFKNNPPSAKINDINQNLIELYQNIKKDACAVWEIYRELLCDKEFYYKYRDSFNSMDDSFSKSAYFLLLNHMCFNGIYRTNSKNQFNTPYGGEKLSKMDKETFFSLATKLKGAEFYNEDFEYFLRMQKPHKSFIYMDPPYFTDEKRMFREYNAKTFTHSDLVRLRKSCSELVENNNRIVVSYWDCSEFRELFHEHIVSEHTIRRNVGGFKDRRAKQNELIAVFDKCDY